MAGLLADVFSFGDTIKRKARGLLDDPMGTISQFVNNENDRARAFNQLTSQSTNEMISGQPMGPASQKLAGLLADAYNPAGMFIGATAKTWDKAAAEKAQKMLREGVDPRQVWKETGTFKGADGALRQEIDDSVADFPVVKKYRRSDLDASVLHEPLEAAYPDVKGIQIEFSPGGTLSGGEYRPNVKFHDIGPRESIVLRNSELSRQSNKSIGLHEIQHAIQQREGWAKGGSPDDATLMPYVRKFYADNIDGFLGESHQLVEMAKQRAYNNLAGEAEARATQARMNMNAAQRREVYPFDSYDVPLDQLIVRGGLLGDAKSIPQAPQAEALETARKNAVKMLGLPENNTPMDRAKALGFDMDGFHATGADIRKIDPEMIAKSDYGTIGQGFYIDPSKSAGYSNLVARINQSKSPQNIIPVKFRSSNLYDLTGVIGPTSSEASKRLTANMKDAGYSGTLTYMPDGSINEVAVFDPSIVRSRFAAFDPARVNENDLLGRADPALLGLLGLGVGGGAYMMSDK